MSITRSLNAKDTERLLSGDLVPADALSRAQVRYLRRVANRWPLPPALEKLGPIRVQRYRARGNLGEVDISRLPNDEQYIEISRRVPLADAPRTMAFLREELRRADVALCSDQYSAAGSKLRALVR